MDTFRTPPAYNPIAPADDSNQKTVDDKVASLKSDLEKRLADYKKQLSSGSNHYNKRFFEDLVNATQTDLNELNNVQKNGSLADKVATHNRIARELQLEVKYQRHRERCRDLVADRPRRPAQEAPPALHALLQQPPPD